MADPLLQMSLLPKVKLDVTRNRSRAVGPRNHGEERRELLGGGRGRRAGTPRVVSTGCSQWQAGLFPRLQLSPNKPGSKAGRLVPPSASDRAAPVLNPLLNFE